MKTRGWTAYHTGPVLLRAVERDRPEMFAWNDDDERSVASMCFSHTEFHDMLEDRLSRILRERPELDFVEVGAMDGPFKTLSAAGASNAVQHIYSTHVLADQGRPAHPTANRTKPYCVLNTRAPF